MGKSIHKAVIPVAGLGTRMRPLSLVVPKAMMPIVDRRGRILPVLHHILAEAAAGGVRQAAVIASRPHVAMLTEYFRRVGKTDYPLPGRIEFLVQEEPLGFGHAVGLARGFVGGERFLLLLGDHVYLAAKGAQRCAAQVAEAFDAVGGAAMIGMQPVDAEELPRVGVAGGVRIKGGIYRCAGFVEKPDLKTARLHLTTPGLPKDRFLAHCGIYAFSPEIFDCIAELTAAGKRGQEIQLADAQSLLLKRHPADYYLVKIKGHAHDTGTPAGYAATLAVFRK